LATNKENHSSTSPYFKLIAAIITGLMTMLTLDIRDIKTDIKNVIVKQEQVETRLTAVEAHAERNTYRLDQHDEQFREQANRVRKFYETYQLKRRR